MTNRKIDHLLRSNKEQAAGEGKLVKLYFMGGCAFAALFLLCEHAEGATTIDQPIALPPGQSGKADLQVAPPQNNTLTEIVVTAQKRAERLQDVPISVTALSGTQLANSGIASTKDLQFAVPAFTTSEFSGFAQNFLRGVGTDIIVSDAEAGVATYEDGVYQPLVLSQLGSLLGIQRVEVLYGPQGTLFGRNAVGGAINIVSLTPSQQFDADLKASFGDYSRREVSGYISGPLSDKLAIGIYAATTSRDSYLNFYPDRPAGSPKEETSSGVRIKAVATPTNTLKITGTLEYRHVDGAEAAALRQLQPNSIGFLFGAPLVIKPLTIEADAPLRNFAEMYKGVLNIEKDFSWAELISISAYQHVRTFDETDSDATTTPLLGGGNTNDDIPSFSQELRLQSTNSSAIKWIGGLFYFDEKGGFAPNHTGLLGGISPVPGEFAREEQIALQTTQSEAAFGQFTVPIIGGLSATLGARYSVDEKEVSNREVKIYLLDNLEQTFTTNPLQSGTVLADSLYPDEYKSWYSFTPKATLDYKIDNTLLYVTYSKGFKAGTFLYANPADVGPVNPEKLTDVEGGLKSEFFDRRLRLNLSAYHYDYSNLQVSLVETIGGVPTQTFVNAGDAKIYGGDISATALLFQGFTLSASAAYTHARYVDGTFSAIIPAAVGGTAENVDLAGRPVQRVPEWTTSLTANYERKFDDRSGVFASVLWSTNSGFSWDPSDIYRQKAYNEGNATLGYTLPGGHYSVSFWVTNFTNTFYERNVLPITLGILASDAPPRMFGVTLEYKL